MTQVLFSFVTENHPLVRFRDVRWGGLISGVSLVDAWESLSNATQSGEVG